MKCVEILKNIISGDRFIRCCVHFSLLSPQMSFAIYFVMLYLFISCVYFKTHGRKKKLWKKKAREREKKEKNREKKSVLWKKIEMEKMAIMNIVTENWIQNVDCVPAGVQLNYFTMAKKKWSCVFFFHSRSAAFELRDVQKHCCWFSST